MNGDAEREQRFWWATIPLLTAISMGKAIRLPNYKSATQAQIDYRLGFIKRGMFGAVFARPLHLEHYQRYAVFSWVALLATVLLLWLFTWKSGLRRRVLTGEVAALFFTGYALTYMAHMVGYFEVVLLALTLALLMIKPFWIRLLAGIPVTIFALAIHELFLIVFVPVLLFSFLVQASAQTLVQTSAPPTRDALDGPTHSSISRKIRTFVPGKAAAWVACTVLLAVSLGVTVRLALRPPLTGPQLSSMRSATSELADFPTDEAMYEVLVRSTADNLVIMRDAVTHAPWWRQQLVSLITMGPTVALLLVTTGLVLRSGRQAPRWLFGAAIGAGLSPLGMHLLGFDVARFNAMVILTSFLVLLTACFYTAGPPVALPPRWRHAVLLVMLLNMASGDLLMDGRVVRPFPFIRELPQVLTLRHRPWTPRDPRYKPQY